MLEVNILGTALGLKWGLRAMRPDGARRQRRHDHQHLLGRRDDRLPRHPGLLGHQVRRRPAHPGRGDGVRQARLRRPRQLRLPRPGPHRHGPGLAIDMANLGLFGSPEEAVGAVVELTPSGRLGEVADMADAVVFLASDASRFINGVGLPVDGGMGM